MYFKYFILINLLYLVLKLSYITVVDFSTTSFISGFMISRLLSELSISDISVDCYINTKNYLIDKINNISTDNIYLNWLKLNNNQLRTNSQTSEIIKNEFRYIINQIKEFTQTPLHNKIKDCKLNTNDADNNKVDTNKLNTNDADTNEQISNEQISNEQISNELDNNHMDIKNNRSENLRKLSYIAKNDKELFSNIHNR